eukprot:11688191-Alexandrium_andersonii.AAC.1
MSSLEDYGHRPHPPRRYQDRLQHFRIPRHRNSWCAHPAVPGGAREMPTGVVDTMPRGQGVRWRGRIASPSRAAASR